MDNDGAYEINTYLSFVFIDESIEDKLNYISERLGKSHKQIVADLIREYYWNLRELEGVASVCAGNWPNEKKPEN